MSTLRAVLVLVLVTLVLPTHQALAASADARTVAPAGTVHRGAGAALNRASGAGMPDTVADFLAAQGHGAATLGSLRTHSQAAAGDFVVVKFGQEVDGLTVYGAGVKATFDGDGNLVTLTDNLATVSGLVAPAGIGHRDALDAALAEVRPDLATGLSETGRSGNAVTFGGDSAFYGDPKVTTIAVAGPGGALGEGFLVEIWGNEDNELDYVVVNGAGRVVYVQNRTANFNERYFAFDEHPDAVGQTNMDDPADFTASPLYWLDPANSDQYPTHIQGFNADTYLDTNGNNIADAPVAPNDGEETFGTFDAVHDPAAEPTDPANQAVAVQNLFYLNNKIHDVLYGHGFDEAAGNFQDSDPVLAEAQDGSGTNNANFSTPPDGSSPRMQMYLWDGIGDSVVDITGGPYVANIAAFGGDLNPAITNQVVALANDGVGSTTDACDSLLDDLTGKIALIDRGTCDFVVKVKNAQTAGAIAAIVANNQGNGILTMGGNDNSINIPAVFVGQDDGAAIAVVLPDNATLSEAPSAPLMRDSALDGDIVWHEAGHGLTWRMIDNMDALQAPAIGEGMSDALSFIMYDDPVVGEYSTSSPDGIRTEPYDTWELTGRSYEDWVGEEHDDGEIYGAIIYEMWELYKNDGSIGDAQNQIMDDLVAGMTVTAGLYDIWPTFVDMRDGILLTISGKTDPETAPAAGAVRDRWCHTWTAFAKYGVGTDQVTTQRQRGFRVTLSWSSGFAVPEACEAGPADTTPPAPSPMLWSSEPHATGTTTIEMTAVTATDDGGRVLLRVRVWRHQL
jgi:hypothetical protein